MESQSASGVPVESVVGIDWDIGITPHDLAAERREIAAQVPVEPDDLPFVVTRAVVDAGAEEEFVMSDQEASKHDQPWGTESHGKVDPSQTRGAGVGGASFAGTPAGPPQENAEAETSGLQPPVGTPYPKQAKSGSPAEPPQGPGAFTEDATPPPVYDV